MNQKISYSTSKSNHRNNDIDINDTNEMVAGRKRLLRHILELIADQSGFLMEEKLDELLRPYAEDEKTFVRLDNVFAAINIRSDQDIEMMKNIFRPYAVCLRCNAKQPSAVSIELKDDLYDSYYKTAQENRQPSILQMRELEEKVSKLRIQAKKEEIVEMQQIEEGHDKRDTRGSLGSNHCRDALKEKDTFQRSQSGSRHQSIYCDWSHPLIIDKCYVLKALKNFVSVLHGDKCCILTGMSSRLAKKRYTISRILSEDDISSYWMGYKKLVPQKIENVWNAVFLALVRYLSILQDRHELNIKAHKLKRQNFELKRLLAHYRSNQPTSQKFSLPTLSSVPDGPIDLEELTRIAELL